MNTKGIGLASRLVMLVLLAAVNCTAGSKVEPLPTKTTQKQKTPADILVYSDRTQGTFVWLEIWQRLAERSGDRLTVTTTLEDFAAKLASGAWSEIKVLARWTPVRAAFVPALIEYSNSHPAQRIQMFLWHDDGAQLDPNVAVAASTGIVTWQNRASTLGYALVSSDVPKAAETRTMPGSVLPDFQDLRPRTPVAIGQASEDSGGRTTVIIADPSACLNACFETFLTQVENCQSQYNSQVAACDALYFPTETDPGDLEAWTNCRSQANTDNTNCLTGGYHRWKNCSDLCKKNSPTTPTQTDSGGAGSPTQAGP